MATFVPMNGSPRKPPTIQIPDVASNAADSSKLCFLDFPAEIRNQINGELLKSDEPVVLIPPEVLEHAEKVAKERLESDDESSERSPTPTEIEDNDVDEIEADEEIEQRDKPDEEDIEESAGRTFVIDLGMLRTCRQVYHEAASIFYGANTFLFTWHPSVHNVTVGQVEYCAEWLTNIGSQFRFLKSVDIDVALVCSTSSDCDDPYICVPVRQRPYIGPIGCLDIYPLVKMIWANPEATCIIQFVLGNQKMDSNLYSHWFAESEEGKSEFAVDLLNKILNCVSRKNYLRLQRYARFERLIKHVLVDRSDGTGSVWYWSSSCTATRRFQTLENGQSKWKKYPLSARILRLSKSLLEKICGLVVQSESGISFNVESNTATNLEPGILGAHSYLRKVALAQLYKMNDFSVILPSSESNTSIDGPTSLEEWWTKTRPGALQFLCPNWARSGPRSLNIILHSRSKTLLSLQEVRFRTLALIRQTRAIPGQYSKRLHITFSVTIGEDGQEYTQSVTLNLEELRIRFFHLLCIVLRDAPQTTDLDAPEIWFNSQGHATEAIFPDSPKLSHTVYRSTHLALDYDQMEGVCLNFVDQFSNLGHEYDSDDFDFDYVHYDEIAQDHRLITLWKFLRDTSPLHWHDRIHFTR